LRHRSKFHHREHTCPQQAGKTQIKKPINCSFLALVALWLFFLIEKLKVSISPIRQARLGLDN
jgi:hypothetical protein